MDARVRPPMGDDVAQAIVDDALTLAMLHDRELSADTIAMLREHGFPQTLGLLPVDAQQSAIWDDMREAISELADPATPELLDDLAAEYAAVYLTGAYQASPYESVWTNEDHLMCQESMFELRRIYADAGLMVEHWRNRPDDHFIFQLLLIAHLAKTAASPKDWAAIGEFMDRHLLAWYPKFAALIAARSRSRFYVMLQLLTAAWCDSLRRMI